MTYNQWMAEQWLEHSTIQAGRQEGDQATFVSGKEKETRTMGYVTRDACPGVGDDIEHVPGMSSHYATER
jgi:hypothetical protein